MSDFHSFSCVFENVFGAIRNTSKGEKRVTPTSGASFNPFYLSILRSTSSFFPLFSSLSLFFFSERGTERSSETTKSRDVTGTSRRRGGEETTKSPSPRLPFLQRHRTKGVQVLLCGHSRVVASHLLFCFFPVTNGSLWPIETNTD